MLYTNTHAYYKRSFYKQIKQNWYNDHRETAISEERPFWTVVTTPPNWRPGCWGPNKKKKRNAKQNNNIVVYFLNFFIGLYYLVIVQKYNCIKVFQNRWNKTIPIDVEV